MYDELVNELRDEDDFEICGAYDILGRAADAIEELSKRIDRAIDLYNRNIEKTAIYEALLGISPEPLKEENK